MPKLDGREIGGEAVNERLLGGMQSFGAELGYGGLEGEVVAAVTGDQNSHSVTALTVDDARPVKSGLSKIRFVELLHVMHFLLSSDYNQEASLRAADGEDLGVNSGELSLEVFLSLRLVSRAWHEVASYHLLLSPIVLPKYYEKMLEQVQNTKKDIPSEYVLKVEHTIPIVESKVDSDGLVSYVKKGMLLPSLSDLLRLLGLKKDIERHDLVMQIRRHLKEKESRLNKLIYEKFRNSRDWSIMEKDIEKKESKLGISYSFSVLFGLLSAVGFIMFIASAFSLQSANQPGEPDLKAEDKWQFVGKVSLVVGFAFLAITGCPAGCVIPLHDYLESIKDAGIDRMPALLFFSNPNRGDVSSSRVVRSAPNHDGVFIDISASMAS